MFTWCRAVAVWNRSRRSRGPGAAPRQRGRLPQLRRAALQVVQEPHERRLDGSPDGAQRCPEPPNGLRPPRLPAHVFQPSRPTGPLLGLPGAPASFEIVAQAVDRPRHGVGHAGPLRVVCPVPGHAVQDFRLNETREVAFTVVQGRGACDAPEDLLRLGLAAVPFVQVQHGFVAQSPAARGLVVAEIRVQSADHRQGERVHAPAITREPSLQQFESAQAQNGGPLHGVRMTVTPAGEDVVDTNEVLPGPSLGRGEEPLGDPEDVFAGVAGCGEGRLHPASRAGDERPPLAAHDGVGPVAVEVVVQRGRPPDPGVRERIAAAGRVGDDDGHRPRLCRRRGFGTIRLPCSRK